MAYASLVGGGRVEAEVVATDGLVRVRYVNRGDQPVRVERLHVLEMDEAPDLGPGEGEWAVWKQGWQSWSYAGPRPLHSMDIYPRSIFTRSAHADPSWAPPREPGIFQSEGMLMLGRPGGGNVLLVGFVGGARQLGRLELRAGAPLSRLEAWCELDGVVVPPGGAVESEPLLVLVAPEGEALETYASAVGRYMGARVPKHSPAVWCSWYYHFTRVREQDVLSAVAGLKGLPIDVVQLDDGYMPAVGDWFETNAKFPHGLAWLSRQIQAAGYRPGLWLAPFIALRKSRLYREHPGWFLRDGKGRPVVAGWNPGWGDIYYALDTTHPEVEAWLTRLTKTMVGHGFTYLKLDFLYGAAMVGRRHDAGVTRAEALRRGLEIIRRAAGEEVFLLGCGSPMLPAVGVVDGMRVGPDVAPTWRFKFWGLPILGSEPGAASARNALQVAMQRQWMHGHFWANDPDSMILRECELTAEEARTLAVVSALSGGIASFSDQPARVPAERLDWLRRVLPVVPGKGFRPVTHLAEPIPLVSSVESGSLRLTLLVNGEDQFRRVGAVTVPPHGCRVLIAGTDQEWNGGLHL